MPTNRLGYVRTRCTGPGWPLWFLVHWRIHNRGIEARDRRAKPGTRRAKNSAGFIRRWR